VKWDSIWYLTIMRDGHQSLQQLVFFPGFPTFLRLFRLFSGESFLWLYLLVNYAIGQLNTLLMYRLSSRVLDNDKLAFVSTLFYIFNPSSVFFNSVYSENLFSFLTLLTLFIANFVIYFIFRPPMKTELKAISCFLFLF
jgi:hypothetical protein